MDAIELGDTVRDRVTETKGVYTGYAEYLNGCKRVLIEGKVRDDGKFSSDWFDEDRVEFISSGQDLREVVGFDTPVRVARAGGPVTNEAPSH